MKRFAAAGIFLAMGFGIANAEDFFAAITKVDGSKITMTKFQKGKGKGDETTLTATSDVKVTKGKKKGDAGEAVEGGLKSDSFAKGNTVTARVTTDDDNKVTAIRVMNVQKANEINALIKKIDGDKITYVKTQGFGFGFGKKKDADTKEAEELSVIAASNCKVVKGKFDAETKKLDFVAVDGGLKNDIFKEQVRARITLDSDNKAAEVRVFQGGGFKKKKKDTN